MGEERQKCPTCFEATLEDMAVCFTKPNVLQKWCAGCGTFVVGDDVRVPTRSPFAQSAGKGVARGYYAAGLLIVAADAVERANKKIVDAASPVFVLEDVLEALAAMIEDQNAIHEDVAAFLVQKGDVNPGADPERLRDLLARTLRTRRLRT